MGISSLILFLAATHLTLPNGIFVTMWSEQLLNMYILVSHQQTRSRKLSTSWSCAAHQQSIWLELGSYLLSGYIFASSWVIFGCKEFSQQKVTPHLVSSPVPWKSIHDWRQYYQKLQRAFQLILSEAKKLVNSNFIILQCPSPERSSHTNTISLHNLWTIGEDRDVSNAANQKPTPQYQLGISLLVLSWMKLMSLETTNWLGRSMCNCVKTSTFTF
jgi:hypothetical protein